MSVRTRYPHKLHHKKGKYYVSVAVPKQLKHLFSEGRIRRSTGTSDYAIAQQRAVNDIMPEIERLLEKAERSLDPFIECLRPILEREGVDVQRWYVDGELSHTISIATFAPHLHVAIQSEKVKRLAREFGPTLRAKDYLSVCKLLTKLGYAVPEYALGCLSSEDRHSIVAEATNPTYNHQILGKMATERPELLAEPLGQAFVGEMSNPQPTVVIDSSAVRMPMFSDWSRKYIEDHEPTDSRDVHRKRVKACEMFLRVCGDKPLDEYDKAHALDMARYMDKDPEHAWGNKTISNYYTYVRRAFIYAGEQRNDVGEIILKTHPFHDVKLSAYGVPTKSYLPFSAEELHKLFRVHMGAQERLLLAILITTGMRLDEVALMTWERIRPKDGVLCFDLTDDEAIVKNKGSQRWVPMPDIIKPMMPKSGAGRLFNYRIDAEGKAENAASKKVMPIIKKIRTSPRQTAHSLRGTLKDLLRDAGVTKETQDFITGHGQGDTAGEYGVGPSMRVRLEALNSVDHPWLTTT